MTLLTSLWNANPFFMHIREGSNFANDFLRFLQDAILADYIVADDFVVLDNASIHLSLEVLEELEELQSEFQFKLLFLPTYSPELNPCVCKNEILFAVP